MAVIIIMAVYDTESNKRTDYTRRTLKSLMETVDFEKHFLFISDNGSCDETQRLYTYLEDNWGIKYGTLKHLTICKNGKNLGTAEAVNKGIHVRLPGQHIIKCDNDVIWHQEGWADLMNDAVNRDENLGILGLKRNDLEQRPDHENPNYKSNLVMLPHEKGDRWIVIEQAKDIMGTCQMVSSKLLDKIGYFYQPAKYGFDDVLLSIRSKCAGFYNAFLPQIEIDHIDVGGDAFCDWKQKHSGEQWAEIRRLSAGYTDGSIPIYYSPYDKK